MNWQKSKFRKGIFNSLFKKEAICLFFLGRKEVN
jgi:hypothetical protein